MNAKHLQGANDVLVSAKRFRHYAPGGIISSNYTADLLQIVPETPQIDSYFIHDLHFLITKFEILVFKTQKFVETRRGIVWLHVQFDIPLARPDSSRN